VIPDNQMPARAPSDTPETSVFDGGTLDIGPSGPAPPDLLRGPESLHPAELDDHQGSVFRPIKVIDIHLDRPLVTLSGLERYQSVRALVRLHGAPLGYVRLPVVRGRCLAGAQRDAIVERLAGAAVFHIVEDELAVGLSAASAPRAPTSIKASHPERIRRLPSVTVAVCTRDHVASLEGCLESIAQLIYPELEVVVVDNAPTSDAAQTLIAARWPQMRYVVEERPGLNWARNRAIREARGEIVAFTDDDTVVDQHWVEAIGRVFSQRDDVSAVTGLVIPLELETRAQMLFEIYGGFGRGFKPVWYTFGPTSREHVGAGRFGTGANMAFKKNVVDELGGFDQALDVGTVTNGGGDIEMFFRVLQEGYTLVYEPAAIVRHRHRRSFDALRIQLTNHGVGFYSYVVRSMLAYPGQRRRFVNFAGWWLVHWILRRLALSVARPGRFPRELVLAELRGGLIGLTRYPKARREAKRLAGLIDTRRSAEAVAS
jgi:O-antigen biosynthesis protein